MTGDPGVALLLAVLIVGVLFALLIVWWEMQDVFWPEDRDE